MINTGECIVKFHIYIPLAKKFGFHQLLTYGWMHSDTLTAVHTNILSCRHVAANRLHAIHILRRAGSWNTLWWET